MVRLLFILLAMASITYEIMHVVAHQQMQQWGCPGVQQMVQNAKIEHIENEPMREYRITKQFEVY
jgi:hypothetical protein